MLTQEAGLATLDWTPMEESVVPNNHGVMLAAFSWDDQEANIVPGHHQEVAAAFSWANVSLS